MHNTDTGTDATESVVEELAPDTWHEFTPVALCRLTFGESAAGSARHPLVWQVVKGRLRHGTGAGRLPGRRLATKLDGIGFCSSSRAVVTIGRWSSARLSQ